MGPGPPARAGARARARARRPGGGGSGAAALAGTWLTRPGAAGWRENKAAGGRGSWAQQFRGNFFFPLLAAPRPPCGGGGPRGPRGGRRGAAGRGRLPGRPPPATGGGGGSGARPPPLPPAVMAECVRQSAARTPPACSHSHTHSHAHTHTHTHTKGRSHILARARPRGGGGGGAGGEDAQRPFRARRARRPRAEPAPISSGAAPSAELTKWGRPAGLRGEAGGRTWRPRARRPAWRPGRGPAAPGGLPSLPRSWRAGGPSGGKVCRARPARAPTFTALKKHSPGGGGGSEL